MYLPLAFNLGPMELTLIGMLALLLFGGKRLPGLARDLGKGIRDFRKSLAGEIDEEQNQAEVKKVSPPRKKAKKNS